jgi:hypothetical protein
VVEAAVEEVVAEEVAVEEVVEAEEEVRHHPHPNRSYSRAKMKESWDNFHKYSTETAPKLKPLWKRSKDISALIPMSMGLTPL